MPDGGGSVGVMVTYPASERLTRPPLAYAGHPAVGQTLAVGGGLLSQRSGLPVFVPVGATASPESLRRP